MLGDFSLEGSVLITMAQGFTQQLMGNHALKRTMLAQDPLIQELIPDLIQELILLAPTKA